MDQLQKDIDELLRRDSILEAEQEMGVSYKECDAVAWRGMSIMHEINDKKKAAAILTMDTYWCMPLRDYIQVIEKLGFKQVYCKAFSAFHCGSDVSSHHYIYWLKEKGILLTFDTYRESEKDGSINGGTFYYNIRPNDQEHFNLMGTSSGGLDQVGNDWYWVGNHDCREAVRHHIDILAENGTFQPKWVKRPFLWLLTWADSKVEGYDYNAINEQVISELPPEVRDAITPDAKQAKTA